METKKVAHESIVQTLGRVVLTVTLSFTVAIFVLHQLDMQPKQPPVPVVQQPLAVEVITEEMIDEAELIFAQSCMSLTKDAEYCAPYIAMYTAEELGQEHIAVR